MRKLCSNCNCLNRTSNEKEEEIALRDLLEENEGEKTKNNYQNNNNDYTNLFSNFNNVKNNHGYTNDEHVGTPFNDHNSNLNTTKIKDKKEDVNDNTITLFSAKSAKGGKTCTFKADNNLDATGNFKIVPINENRGEYQIINTEDDQENYYVNKIGDTITELNIINDKTQEVFNNITSNGSAIELKKLQNNVMGNLLSDIFSKTKKPIQKKSKSIFFNNISSTSNIKGNLDDNLFYNKNNSLFNEIEKDNYNGSNNVIIVDRNDKLSEIPEDSKENLYHGKNINMFEIDTNKKQKTTESPKKTMIFNLDQEIDYKEEENNLQKKEEEENNLQKKEEEENNLQKKEKLLKKAQEEQEKLNQKYKKSISDEIIERRKVLENKFSYLTNDFNKINIEDGAQLKSIIEIEHQDIRTKKDIISERDKQISKITRTMEDELGKKDNSCFTYLSRQMDQNMPTYKTVDVLPINNAKGIDITKPWKVFYKNNKYYISNGNEINNSYSDILENNEKKFKTSPNGLDRIIEIKLENGNLAAVKLKNDILLKPDEIKTIEQGIKGLLEKPDSKSPKINNILFYYVEGIGYCYLTDGVHKDIMSGKTAQIYRTEIGKTGFCLLTQKPRYIKGKTKSPSKLMALKTSNKVINSGLGGNAFDKNGKMVRYIMKEEIIDECFDRNTIKNFSITDEKGNKIETFYDGNLKEPLKIYHISYNNKTIAIISGNLDNKKKTKLTQNGITISKIEELTTTFTGNTLHLTKKDGSKKYTIDSQDLENQLDAANLTVNSLRSKSLEKYKDYFLNLSCASIELEKELLLDYPINNKEDCYLYTTKDEYKRTIFIVTNKKIDGMNGEKCKFSIKDNSYFIDTYIKEDEIETMTFDKYPIVDTSCFLSKENGLSGNIEDDSIVDFRQHVLETNNNSNNFIDKDIDLAKTIYKFEVVEETITAGKKAINSYRIYTNNKNFNKSLKTQTKTTTTINKQNVQITKNINSVNQEESFNINFSEKEDAEKLLKSLQEEKKDGFSLMSDSTKVFLKRKAEEYIRFKKFVSELEKEEEKNLIVNSDIEDESKNLQEQEKKNNKKKIDLKIEKKKKNINFGSDKKQEIEKSIENKDMDFYSDFQNDPSYLNNSSQQNYEKKNILIKTIPEENIINKERINDYKDNNNIIYDQ